MWWVVGLEVLDVDFGKLFFVNVVLYDDLVEIWLLGYCWIVLLIFVVGVEYYFGSLWCVVWVVEVFEDVLVVIVFFCVVFLDDEEWVVVVDGDIGELLDIVGGCIDDEFGFGWMIC